MAELQAGRAALQQALQAAAPAATADLAQQLAEVGGALHVGKLNIVCLML